MSTHAHDAGSRPTHPHVRTTWESTPTHFARFDHDHNAAADDVYRFADVVRVQLLAHHVAPQSVSPLGELGGAAEVVVAHVQVGGHLVPVHVSRWFADDEGDEREDTYRGFLTAWIGPSDNVWQRIWS